MRKARMVALIIALAASGLPLRPPAAAPRCYPTNRFVTQSSGTMKDALTSLVWQQDGSGTRAGCTGSGNLTCTWVEAQSYCSGLTLGGYSDWRLPTVKELSSIVEFTAARPGPTIDQTAFPSTPAEQFWTSSPSAGSSSEAWFVSFDSGESYRLGVGNFIRVRCVR